MSDYFVAFLVITIALAALLHQDFVLTLVYFVLGVYAFSRWWTNRAVRAVSIQRTFTNRAFLGDKVTIKLDIVNTGILPVVWLRLHDSLPVELVGAEIFRQVVTLGAHGRVHFEYVLHPNRRGYYQIGPLFLYTGDVLGLGSEYTRQGVADHLTVYPRIVPLTHVGLPSRSPMGTLRHVQPMFEDPTRIRGKRDYVAGDSLRRIDWKASATSGRLQVKLFEPSIALETAIFLNLNSPEYYYRSRNDATELAIIVAASVASWVVSQKQTVGLATNGIDILSTDGRVPMVPPEKGRGHLMRILDILARIQIGETRPLAQLMQQERVNLSWGTTVVLITGQVEDALFDEVFQARRAGMNVVLILCGHVVEDEAIKHKAEHFGIPVHPIVTEKDLDRWRQ